jgi:LmbE family N-acetylglucosaminyl deacetylase
MGLAMLHYIANGMPVHLVSMTNGSALGVANTLNGSTDTGTAVSCTISDHPYIHSPSREGYPLVSPATRLTVDDIGAARNREARSALAAMAMVPPVTPGVVAPVFHHTENLPGDFAGSTSSSTSPVTPEGIATAKTIIKRYVDEYPNSFHFTMSQTDDHHDHAACGFALRELKDDTVNKVPWGDLTYAQALVNARFFVSRLYWAISQPDGQYPADVASMPGLAWFNYYGSNYQRYVDWMRNQVIKPYRAWNPAEGSYGIGYHQVSAQFNSNFGPNASVANLWHA